MLYLYFVRHGQTEWNVAKKIQGRQNSNLTEKGVEDARQLGKSLKDIDWTGIYSSPSSRAVKTAEIIKGDFPILINQDKGLMEMHLDDWEGMTMEEIKAINTHQHNNYWNHPSLFQHEAGESFEDVKERLKQFIAELLLKHESGSILIVTHGVVIKMVQNIGNQYNIDQLWNTPYIDGTSVTKLKIVNEKIEILLEGDLSHRHFKI